VRSPAIKSLRLMQRHFPLVNKEYYLFNPCPGQGLVCAFSRRALGNMSLSYGDTRDSLENRKDFLKELGIDYRDLVCSRQVHSSQIRYVTEKDRAQGALSYQGAIADTDALISDKKNLPLAVFTADCLSIFLYEPNRQGIGLVHAGWRSTQENITTKVIQSMRERFNIQAGDLYLGFGPAIRGCCYEVGEEFGDLFPHALIQRGGRYYLDLVKINKKEALSLGVKDTNIFDSNICTSCQNDEFFSYRKEGAGCGRIMSVMAMAKMIFKGC